MVLHICSFSLLLFDSISAPPSHLVTLYYFFALPLSVCPFLFAPFCLPLSVCPFPPFTLYIGLTFALEPEAASLCCREENKDQIATFPPGTKYMVLDGGGGTFDITVHEVTESCM